MFNEHPVYVIKYDELWMHMFLPSCMTGRLRQGILKKNDNKMRILLLNFSP